MTTATYVEIQDDHRDGRGKDVSAALTLDIVAVRLTAEYPQVTAGSILRCVFRAAHGLRVAGVPHARVPAEAERVARALLERRSARR